MKRVLLTLFVIFGLWACGSGDDSNLDATDTTQTQDGVTSTDTTTQDSVSKDLAGIEDVDAFTGATGHAEPLVESHSGWKNPTCWTCHEADTHNEGLDPYLCADCHGTNGAPAGHSDSNTCNTCHDEPHGAEGFPVPLSCKACHTK